MNGLFLLAGLIVGAILLRTQAWTVNRISPRAGAGAAGWLIVGLLGRLALVGLLFYAALRQGIAPGLLAGAGLLSSRWLLLAWLERTNWHWIED
jgi:hypothetical protein